MPQPKGDMLLKYRVLESLDPYNYSSMCHGLPNTTPWAKGTTTIIEHALSGCLILLFCGYHLWWLALGSGTHVASYDVGPLRPQKGCAVLCVHPAPYERAFTCHLFHTVVCSVTGADARPYNRDIFDLFSFLFFRVWESLVFPQAKGVAYHNNTTPCKVNTKVAGFNLKWNTILLSWYSARLKILQPLISVSLACHIFAPGCTPLKAGWGQPVPRCFYLCLFFILLFVAIQPGSDTARGG